MRRLVHMNARWAKQKTACLPAFFDTSSHERQTPVNKQTTNNRQQRPKIAIRKAVNKKLFLPTAALRRRPDAHAWTQHKTATLTTTTTNKNNNCTCTHTRKQALGCVLRWIYLFFSPPLFLILSEKKRRKRKAHSSRGAPDGWWKNASWFLLFAYSSCGGDSGNGGCGRRRCCCCCCLCIFYLVRRTEKVLPRSRKHIHTIITNNNKQMTCVLAILKSFINCGYCRPFFSINLL